MAYPSRSLPRRDEGLDGMASPTWKGIVVPPQLGTGTTSHNLRELKSNSSGGASTFGGGPGPGSRRHGVALDL